MPRMPAMIPHANSDVLSLDVQISNARPLDRYSNLCGFLWPAFNVSVLEQEGAENWTNHADISSPSEALVGYLNTALKRVSLF